MKTANFGERRGQITLLPTMAAYAAPGRLVLLGIHHRARTGAYPRSAVLYRESTPDAGHTQVPARTLQRLLDRVWRRALGD